MISPLAAFPRSRPEIRKGAVNGMAAVTVP